MSDLTVLPVTVEHHREPLGIGENRPRMSWTVQTDTPDWRQAAYELEIAPEDGDVWSSGRVDSAESVLVAWAASPLASRERRTVRVRVWGGGAGEPSEWSEETAVETGLLETADWSAQLALPVPPAAGDEPALLLRREFTLEKPVARARLYVTALGVYEAELNGEPVGDQVLAPGWTSYHHRLRYQTHDVTEQLTDGVNALGVQLADGWYRGYFGFTGARAHYGERTGLFLQLEITHSDGSRTTIVSDDRWRSGASPTTRAGIYGGETFDARFELAGWSAPGFDDSDWTPVEVGSLDISTLVAPTGPPVRRTEVLPARVITRSPSGATLVDFGQNLVGRIRFRLPDAPAGTEITVRHAEVLEHGELGTRPLRKAWATDVVVLDGKGAREWEPRFTFHGFHYAEVTGWPGELAAADLEAVVVHTDLRRTGWFSCSDADVNRLHENVVWGMRGNFLDVPTDCPQRDERLGWTGDLQVFAPTASFLFETSGMLRSWLADLAVEQLEDHGGQVPNFVPFLDLMPFPAQAEVGWGDAAVVVPWVLYQRHGDAKLLADQWGSMTAWIDAFEERAGAELDFPGGDSPSATGWTPRRHRRTLVRHGHRGSAWPPPICPVRRRSWPAPRGARARREPVRDAGGTRGGTVPRRVRDPERSGGVRRPDRLCAGTGVRPGGTGAACAHRSAARRAGRRRRLPHRQRLPRYTADHRRADERRRAVDRVRAASAAGNPSWLYPVTMGATTIWERWDSMLPDGSINPGEMTSFNHYAFGAVADWLHRTVGGLASAAPGSRRLRVAPRPGPGITSAATSHETPYGLAEVVWTLDGGAFSVDVVVPPNSTAEVALPDRSASVEIGSGRHSFACSIPVPVPVEKPVPFWTPPE